MLNRKQDELHDLKSYSSVHPNAIRLSRLNADGYSFKCCFCGEGSPHTYHLYEHLRLHTNVELHQCSADRRQHEEDSECRNCLLTFKSGQFRNLKSHSNNEFNSENRSRPVDKLHSNILCIEEFSSPSCMKESEHATSGDRLPQNVSEMQGCSNNLEKYMKIRGDGRPFQCLLCSKRFTQSAHLRSHFKTHNRGKPCMLILEGGRPFECLLCGKRYKEKFVLSNHIRTHTGKRPYRCTICMKEFITSTSLKTHHMTHVGKIARSCLKVVKDTRSGFKILQNVSYDNLQGQTNIMEKHIKVLDRGRLFQCILCSKQFTTKANVRVHIRIHTGEKPYKCNICMKKFTQLGHLQSHVRTHTCTKSCV